MRIPKKRYLIPTFVVLLLLIRFVSEIGYDKSPRDRFKVVGIIDGDTIELTGGDRLRLLGIDCPEKGEPFHDSAQAFLRNLILSKNPDIVYCKRRRDGYGRRLGYLYLDTLWVNREIIRKGLAGVYLFDDNIDDQTRVEQLLAAQREAIAAKSGIWSIRHSPEEYYLAKKGSFRFHRPICHSLQKTDYNELVKFSTREEASQLGYSPCRNCHP